MGVELGIVTGGPRGVEVHADPAPAKILRAGDSTENKVKSTLARGAPGGIDQHIYLCKKTNPEWIISDSAATSAKNRDVDRIIKAVNVCATVPHATVAVADYVTRVEPQIGINLGIVREYYAQKAVAADLLKQVKASFHAPRCYQKNTNDALSYQKTLCSAIAPPSPPVGSTKKAKDDHKMVLKQMAGQLELTGSMKRRLEEASDENRDLKAASPEVRAETKLCQVYSRRERSDKFITPELKEAFAVFLLTCEATVDSPNKKDCIIARKPDGRGIMDAQNGGWLKVRKRLYERGLGYLYWVCTRPVVDGGFAGFRDTDGNICVSQSTMERMMPYNYSRLKESHKASCMCSDCMDAQYQHEGLMGWRNCKLTHLEKRVEKNKSWLEKNQLKLGEAYKKVKEQQAAATKELAEFKKDVFYYDRKEKKLKQRGTTMEAALDLMTCKPVGPQYCQPTAPMIGPQLEGTVESESKFHPYNCCLGRCDDCPSLPLNHGEQKYVVPDDENSIDMIVWRKHEHRYHCKLHGSNRTEKCSRCEELPAGE